MEHEFKFFVGIDWATEEHQVHVMDERRKAVGERVVKHSGTAIAELVGWLAKLGEPASIAVAIETPRGAVVEMLLERGFAVFHLNPKQLDRFRDRHTVAGAKDDRRDAMVLADSLRTDTHLFHRVRLDEDDVILLRELVRSDDDLAKEANGLTNRLREQLLRYFPQVLELSSSADEPWVWDLLIEVPTPQAAAAKAASKGVAEVLKRHRIRRIDADGVLKILRQPPLSVAAGTIAAATAHIGLLVPRLRLVETQRKAVEKQVKGLLATIGEKEPSEGQKSEHRDVTVLLSLPGVGWKVSATMLVEASQALAERDYLAVRSLAGVAPITKQTGKNKRGRVEMRRAANNRLRNATYHWARVSAQVDVHAKAHYAALRARGHSHGRALRSVADRNLRLLMAMLRDGTLYDPAHPRKIQPDAAAA
jgi:transposase